VSAKSTGAALGGLLGNLRSGRGLFGEKATMNAVSKVTGTIADAMSDGMHTYILVTYM